MTNKDAEQTALDEYIEEVTEESAPQEDNPEVVAEAETDESPEVEIPEVVKETVEEPEKVDKFQERINKVTADKYEERRRADALQAELDELRNLQANNPPKEPTLEDFDYDDEKYQDALVDYRVRQVTAQQNARQQQAIMMQQQAEVVRKFNEKAAKFEADHPDFQAVTSKVPPLQPIVLDAIRKSNQSVELAYYLGKHLDKADAIVTMDGPSAIMEIGRISAILSAPKKVKLSSAPEPIDALTSSGAMDTDIGDNDMSMAQWMKKYNP